MCSAGCSIVWMIVWMVASIVGTVRYWASSAILDVFECEDGAKTGFRVISWFC